MLRVLRQVAQVPDRTKVTKRGGEKVYTARHKIAIWDDGKPEFLEPTDGTVFLVDHEGTISVVPGTTEVLANFELGELEKVVLTDSVFYTPPENLEAVLTAMFVDILNKENTHADV